MTKINKSSIYHLQNQSGYVHFALLVMGLALLGSIIATQIQTTTSYPNRPEQVLGDSSDTSFTTVQSKEQVTQELLTSNEINSISNYSISGQNNDIYTVSGTKTFHVLGIIPVFMPVTVSISAESGNLLTKQQSLLSNLLQTISR